MSDRVLRLGVKPVVFVGALRPIVCLWWAASYKPDPRAYRLGLDALQLTRNEIVFAAFGGWDAAGATTFGYPTVWVNRFGQPMEVRTR